ncbi:hypothetical protein [Aeromonas dhakensis]|uniref:hypothetical protein n=1 Tax=Aeromonas dhakensis TaxID=196024 RepID=UPI001BFC6211|nr:hypothetical protein [Aeromonas dhakensis]HDT5890716.1 hypothetical protein [Aeromonas dhakensis]HDT5895024.1 hypothetical protein [Aeromonas hydrophila subsp. hydrophila]HEB4980230.1 hypothetical protein [Aeromonas dhakensis]
MLALETRLETMAQQAMALVKSMEAARMAAIEVSREQDELEPVELLLIQMISEEEDKVRAVARNLFTWQDLGRKRKPRRR